jgi:hypothetical protein
MTEKAQNKNLNEAKSNKKDEFYTQLSDIESSGSQFSLFIG